jgi:hypothetical protein
MLHITNFVDTHRHLSVIFLQMTPYTSFNGAAAYYGRIPIPETVKISHGIVTGELSDMKARWSAWPEPPHVALVNALLEARAITAFTRTYGPIEEPNSALAPIVRSLTGSAPSPDVLLNLGADEWVSETFSFSLDDFEEAQTRLRLAWRGDRTILEGLRTRVKGANFQVSLFEERAGDVVVRSRLLWDYICLVFLIDHETGKAKVCGNTRCATPYFLRGRTDNNFCSHGCAVTAGNMRRAQQKRGKRS